MWSKSILPAVRMFVALTVLTGVLYPLAITAAGSLVFPRQAHGSLVDVNGAIVGSELIGQANSDSRYFWPRPSAVDYMDGSGPDVLGSSGASNLGPISSTLADQVQQRADAFRSANGLGSDVALPPDVLFASGSGLDPHISPEAALLQVERVAAARGLDPERVTALVEKHVEGPQLGFLGERRVNVLLLNLALDGLGVE